MFPFKSTIGGVVLGALLLPAGATAAYLACQTGVTSGDWDNPHTSGGLGFLSGKLADPTGTFGIYTFDAVLTDVPSPCLSCIGGTIHGTVDDGVGPGPDYCVVGEYSGLFFTGRGKFAVKIVPPGSTTSVGVVEGDFADPPVSSGVGRFKGKWKICP